MSTRSRLLSVLITAVLLSACDGGGKKGNDENTNSVRRLDVGYVFQGSPNARAESQVINYLEETPSDEPMIDNSLGPVYAGLAGVAFSPDATVSEVNTILDEVQGSIVASAENRSYIVIKFPAAHSSTEFDEVLARIEGLPQVDFAHPISPMESQSIPREPNESGPEPDPFLNRIKHHLAVGGAAAWNARRAMTADRPIITVLDYFGGQGKPSDGLGIRFVNPDAFNGGNPSSIWKEHGYHVLGILAGTYSAAPSYELPPDVTDVTGMFPAESPTALNGVVVEMEDEDFSSLYKALFLYRLYLNLSNEVTAGKRVVLNTSIGFKYEDNTDPVAAESRARTLAKVWARLIRGGDGSVPSSMEYRIFHAAAAGNDGTDSTLREAKLGSLWNAGALMSQQDLGIRPLTNTVVVENRVAITRSGLVSVGSLANDSNIHGNLGGIGCTDSGRIFSFTGPEITGLDCGTSMASPQVAGLAAYLWSLQPSLTSAAIKARLIANGKQFPSTDADVASTPVIDAYATVLTADTNENPHAAPVRMTLLDTNTDTLFNETDIRNFLTSFDTLKGEKADYSEFDLNGDGFTGGNRRNRFNLDIQLSKFDIQSNQFVAAEYQPLARVITREDGSDEEMIFDENKLRDIDILCYYAYGSEGALYSGDTSERDRLLGNRCSSVIEVIAECLHNCEAFINNHGDVAFYTEESIGVQQSFLYSKGGRQFIAGNRSYVHGINDASNVVGSVLNTSSGVSEPFLWSPEEGVRNLYTLLQIAGVPYFDFSVEENRGGYAYPRDINNASQMTGNAKFNDGLDGKVSAFIFVPSLESPSFSSGFFDSSGSAQDIIGFHINNLGSVVGQYSSVEINSGFLYKNGETTFFPNRWPQGINDADDIIGHYFLPSDEENDDWWLWSKGVMTDISDKLYSDTYAVMPNAINNQGQVVGISYQPYYQTAFIWDKQNGMQDLNDLVPSNRWSITSALDINDKGQIVAEAKDLASDINQRRIVLFTLPEPPNTQ